MPVQITDSNFIDNFGGNTTAYKSNAGDEITAQFKLRSSIRITSINNPLTLDPTLNVITSPSISWLDEGFRVGDVCRISQIDSGGTVLNSWYSEIVFVDDLECDFTNMPYFYDIANSEILEIYALDSFGVIPPSGFYDARPRADLDVLINHSLAGSQGNTPSLIDGENSRAIFQNMSTLPVGGTQNGVFVGNQSGQFFKSVDIQRTNNNGVFCEYELQITFANSGMYNSAWFATINYLKFFMRLLWASIPADPFAKYDLTYDENANTGFFDEANDTSVVDSTLIQGITELDYCVPTTHDVIIDTAQGAPLDPARTGIGGCYVSIDDSYYRNRIENQYEISMLTPSTNLVVATYISPSNPDGAFFTIDINTTQIVGTEIQINLTFTPSPQFDTFMSNRDDGDRLFYLWIRSGNINHAIFKDQLKCDPPIGGNIDMVTDHGFLDHSENVTEISGNLSGYEANTEDDLAYFGTFLLEKNAIYESFVVKIEAYNTVTEEDFTLQQTTYSFGGIPISNAGQYLINETSPVNTDLPNNSEKINSKFYLFPSIDTPTEYGVAIYYPYLLNWRYWLEQTNASVDFYPTQNQNWEQYDNLADWELRLELVLIRDGLAYTHGNVIIDKEYDSEPIIDQSIELYIDSTGANVGVVTIGELMRVVATHTLNDGSTWDQTSNIWGMITVEPTESTPRQMCSTVLAFDNNLNNPLYPLDNVQMIITYPSPEIAQMECFFDPNKIDLTNGCKFTTKIKGCPFVEDEGKTMTDGTQKTTTTGLNKTVAI